ncbi:hypothetical protein CKA34_32520 (plasmid) [Rhizobium sp. 11515TR]|nr:hypothetical protein CKA34_32520 [Rhizobium sp. 11515TR]
MGTLLLTLNKWEIVSGDLGGHYNALAAVKPRECDQPINQLPDKNWKPYPCLLTREELQKLIAEQLG